jgi:hypothetical protein
MGVTIRAIEQEEFEEYPEPKAAPTDDPYADLIPVLRDQGFAEVTVEPPTTMRGARISIGRRAKLAGMAIQMRYDEERNQIAVRNIGQRPPEQPTDPNQQRRRGRPKKQPEE